MSNKMQYVSSLCEYSLVGSAILHQLSNIINEMQRKQENKRIESGVSLQGVVLLLVQWFLGEDAAPP